MSFYFADQSLSVRSFANIFSQFVDCLYVLFIVSFYDQELLSLSKSHLFIFVFLSIILGDGLKKILLQFMSESVLPTYSSRNFTAFDLTFRSLISFELIVSLYLIQDGGVGCVLIFSCEDSKIAINC